MIFFRRRKYAEAHRDAEEVMRPGWLRALLMLGLFLAIGVTYSRHFDNRLAQVQAQSAFWDETKTWSDEDKVHLIRRVAIFQDQWGMRVNAHVRTSPLELPKLNKTTIFIGMRLPTGNPAGNPEAMIVLPDVAMRLLRAENARLGHDTRVALEASLVQCLSNTPSAQCLAQTLEGLERLLQGF